VTSGAKTLALMGAPRKMLRIVPLKRLAIFGEEVIHG
jgi:hypothetical protein